MMVGLSAQDIPKTPPVLPEKRVSLAVDWQGFQTILGVLGEPRSARLTYHNGILEIMTPPEAHENSSDLIGDFIKILVEELGLPVKSMGSTTLQRADLQSGAEPDRGFYIANEPLVRGRTVDLNVDPPPDLVLEVNITHTDINKNALYATLGVPEFWRYNGQVWRIFVLQDGRYVEMETSPTFPGLPKAVLYSFLQDCAQLGEIQTKRNLHSWIQQAMKA
jgi:Uma2 family endonuclease